jgi:hypothetical protein
MLESAYLVSSLHAVNKCRQEGREGVADGAFNAAEHALISGNVALLLDRSAP